MVTIRTRRRSRVPAVNKQSKTDKSVTVNKKKSGLSGELQAEKSRFRVSKKGASRIRKEQSRTS